MHVAVIGAGAFGGWTALFLRRLGHRVTLVDAWGPGNSRSSSGGETRIIRAIYGDDFISVRMAARSLTLWKENQARWQTQLYIQTGALFLGPKDDPYLADSKAALITEGIAVEELSPVEIGRRYPHLDLSGFDNSLLPVNTGLFEHEAGVLFARQNCRMVVRGFVEEGGEYKQTSARPLPTANGGPSVTLHSGETLRADVYVFACGAWLPQIFPEVLGNLIHPTRQDVLFVGTPPGSTCFSASELPCWVDRTSKLTFYGIPDIEHRGFKIAADLRGPAFDPNCDDRAFDSSIWRAAQMYLSRRFPALADAPLLETRVCQYENSADVAFIIDQHPTTENVWLVGGGSGHGYKHGPAIGELVAGLVTGTQAVRPEFGLARFAPGGTARRRLSTI